MNDSTSLLRQHCIDYLTSVTCMKKPFVVLCCESVLILQYNYNKGNETAVREEMVQMANLLDGVRD